MPQSHTNLFYALIKNQSPPFYLDALEISRALSSGEVSYEIMTNLLRETNDAQFGIVSKLNQQNEWVRDATQAISLKDRIPHDHPALEANQALLRCLSRLKPIDYAIGNKKELDAHTMQSIRNNIKRRYADFAQNILLLAENNDITEEKKRKQTMELEQSFNTFLVECLHQANLTWGCETEAEAEKLLFHYRNLSSVLEPSRTLITLTYDKVARIFQRETQYPVTRKTALQKAEMARLKEVVVYPLKTEKNSHTSLPPAMQEANSIFADLIARDDRALPAQTRKTHLVGSKNAFVVKNELIPVQVLPEDTSSLHAQPENVLWLGRMGSPVFVGKGEKETARQTHTRENLEQMRITAQEKMGRKSLKLHLTTLNTVTPLENQATIVSHLYQATRENQTTEDDISYAPTNPDGTFRRLDVSRHLPQDRVGEISPLQKATRLASVSHIMLAARNQKDTFSLVNCASGQDRTGTAVEKTTQDWMKQRYQAFGKDTGNIDHMRAEGGNAAEITTHHVHGSPGMKIESKADNFFGGHSTFSELTNREFYLKSASTNKKNRVEDVSFLKIPSIASQQAYHASCSAFENSIRKHQQNPNLKELCLAAQNVLNEVTHIAQKEPNTLNELKLILDYSKNGLEQLDDSKNTKINAQKLIKIAEHISEHKNSVWQKLAKGLVLFSCAALVAVGALGMIPSGGLTLLLSVAAASAGLELLCPRPNKPKESFFSSVKNYKKLLEKIECETPKEAQKTTQTPEDHKPKRP